MNTHTNSQAARRSSNRQVMTESNSVGLSGDRPLNEVAAPRRRRTTRAVFGLLAALFLATGITAVGTVATSSTASAWSNTGWGGAQGSIRWGQATSCIGCFVARPGYQFDTPQMLIGRNGGIATNRYQELTVRFDMQRSDGTVVGTRSTLVSIDLGASGIGIIGGSAVFPLAGYRTPGWYRVVTTVTWGVQSGAYPSNSWTGYQQFVPSAAGEMRCAYTSSACTAGSGWVFMAG